MTHILISIKDIEEAKKCPESTIDNLIGLITNAKQISLDKKDIEENIKEIEIVILTQQQLLETRFEDKEHLAKMERVLESLQALKDLYEK